MRRIHWKWMLSFALVLGLLAGSASAAAFSDIEGDPGQASIEALLRQGIVSGISKDEFAPRASLTYAQAVHLMVKGFNLNLDDSRFVTESQASDYFLHVPNDAWYANAFITAHLNGLPLPKDVEPTAIITKEQYADLLAGALLTQGEYAFIQIFILIGDGDDVNPAYMQSVQTLLIAKIAELDGEQLFYPRQNVTRSEAAIWLHKALNFVEEHENGENGTEEPQQPKEEIEVSVEAVTGEVNKVILNRVEKPSYGYGISVDSIVFSGETALIRYQLHEPLPDHMYPAVVVEVKTETYVPSQYKVEIEQLP